MKRKWHMQFLIGVLTAVTILAGVWSLPRANASPKDTSPQGGAQLEPLAGPTVGGVGGDYQGSVKLDRVFPGTLDTDPKVTPSPIDLGQIDLSLHLEQMRNGKAGFVILDRTLVFTKEHQISVTPVGPTPGVGTPIPTPHPLDIGPYVNVTPDSATLRLVSDPITMTLNGREIKRQFSLISDNVQAGGATLTGAYRETVWGYAPEPSTVMGSFTLQKPVFPTPSAPALIPRPIIRTPSNHN